MELDSSQQAAQKQFDNRSAHYGDTHPLSNTTDVELSLENIILTPEMTALDIATGGGHTGLFLARRGVQVTFSDISAEMLDKVDAALTKEGLKGELRQHTAEALPYGDGVFDLVTSRVAPHHFSDPQGFIHSAARVLKPGGHFLLIDIVSPDEESEAADWINRVEKLRDPSHVRNYTRSEWMGWVVDAGLSILFAELHPMQQTDLERYFAVADTSAENQAEVHSLIREASEKTRDIFQLGDEDGKIAWWWQRLRLLARKAV
ncbi:MAG: methyltransferase domain-containing protein [Chthoniobacterales bacterium]